MRKLSQIAKMALLVIASPFLVPFIPFMILAHVMAYISVDPEDAETCGENEPAKPATLSRSRQQPNSLSPRKELADTTIGFVVSH